VPRLPPVLPTREELEEFGAQKAGQQLEQEHEVADADRYQTRH